MKRSTTLTSILLIIFFVNAKKVFCQPSLFSYEIYKNSHGDSLRYRFLFPDNDTTRRYPLVVFLHGSGERGTDNEAQLKWGVMNFASDYNMKTHPAFVIAPQCPPNLTWANITAGKNNEVILQPAASKPMQVLMELIGDVIRRFRVDTTRIYITGLSMGGHGTFDALQRYPHFFAAAVPVCARGDISKTASIAHIPLWIFGGADDPNVNPNLLYDMVNALRKAGAHPGFTQYPDVGHFSWIAAYSDPMMIEWLFNQHK